MLPDDLNDIIFVKDIETLRFYNNLNEFVSIDVDLSGYSSRLSMPVILAVSCLTADHADSDLPLSEVFMHLNAGSYAGYGTSANLYTSSVLSDKYIDQLLVKQDLGSIFYNSMRATANQAKSDFNNAGDLDIALADLQYFIQLGYPKWDIDPNLPIPDYSNPLLPNSINFNVINYNISILYNITKIKSSK